MDDTASTCGAGCKSCGVTRCGATATPQTGAAAHQATIGEMRIAVSYLCNLACQHCYVPEENRRQYSRLFPDQLSIEALEGFVDVLAASFGTRSISITGGEALIRPVWPRTERVMRRALDNGMAVRLLTAGSGQVSVEEVLTSAHRRDGLTFQISLDGADPDLVDRFRGRANSWDNAVRTIGEVVDAGAPVLARYTVTDENIEQTLDCYDLVAQRGAAAFVVKPIFSSGTAREHAGLQVTPESVRELQVALAERSVGRRTKLKLPQPCYLSYEDLPAGANVEIMYCGCGSDVAYLTPNGDVYPCTYLAGVAGMERWRLGNIVDPTFDLAAAWNSSDIYDEFRSADKACNCTAQNITRRQEEQLACAT